MGLIKKFNLIFGSIFLAGFLIIGFIFYAVEMGKAKYEAIMEAEVVLENAFAAWRYTAEEVEPLFREKICGSEDVFHPQAVPAYAANRMFKFIDEKHLEYTYREVAANPRNLDNLPTSWEVEILRHYVNHPEEKQMVYTREKKGEEYLYITYPIRITDEKCLKCHTDAETAPKNLVKKYGPVNGMNWKLGEVVGAHLVSVPMSIPKQKAVESLFTMFISLIALFAVMLVSINFMISRWLVRPLSRITRITENISLGKNAGEGLPEIHSREMKKLAQAIRRIDISLKKAMDKIKGKSKED
ncbi:HAMP domain protein [Candidatus Desulfarcum epimagneticum]|uniref:HAMP domain protein n=1 Tax=uncultured Desulfobacteraceae bacterium TaxID=218296 RepID=A0A484HHX9_9BACT|nr:HAMP domain protein [uncultured Desulfobacteraceae bacterium]